APHLTARVTDDLRARAAVDRAIRVERVANLGIFGGEAFELGARAGVERPFRERVEAGLKLGSHHHFLRTRLKKRVSRLRHAYSASWLMPVSAAISPTDRSST